MNDKEKLDITNAIEYKPDLDMVYIDHQDMLVGKRGINRIGVCVGAGATSMAERLMAQGIMANHGITPMVVKPKDSNEVLIKRLKELVEVVEPTPEELLNKRFRNYMYGEKFENIVDIQRHLRLFDPFEKKDRSNQDQLFAIGLDSYEKFEAEYVLIKSKKSKLPSAIRKVVENVWNDVTKSE